MKLILCGGGSGEQNILANQKLNDIIDNTKPLLYVPLAMNEVDYPYDSCLEWVKEELSYVNIPSIEMVRSFEELVSKNYYDYCAIFIGGGNTYKLLKGIKESGAFDKIQEYISNNGIIMGSSAGAVIFGKNIDIISIMDPNNVGLIDTNGFDVLLGTSIFPHYMNTKSKLTKEENIERLEKFTSAITTFSTINGKVIAIPEEDAIFLNDGAVEIIGKSSYYEFNAGQSIKKNTLT